MVNPVLEPMFSVNKIQDLFTYILIAYYFTCFFFFTLKVIMYYVRNSFYLL